MEIPTAVYCLLKEQGMTYQVIERRAAEIRVTTINRFVEEINHLRPFPHQLLFLNETGIDNKAMMRKPGWFFKNKPKVVHDGYLRSKQHSFLDPTITHYLRARGVRVLFLPPHCPFYNPIEYGFGYVKSYCQEHHQANKNPLVTVAEGFMHYSSENSMKQVFNKCGYGDDALFDPSKNFTCTL